jgi:hypothetical protein
MMRGLRKGKNKGGQSKPQTPPVRACELVRLLVLHSVVDFLLVVELRIPDLRVNFSRVTSCRLDLCSSTKHSTGFIGFRP